MTRTPLWPLVILGFLIVFIFFIRFQIIIVWLFVCNSWRKNFEICWFEIQSDRWIVRILFSNESNGNKSVLMFFFFWKYKAHWINTNFLFEIEIHPAWQNLSRNLQTYCTGNEIPIKCAERWYSWNLSGYVCCGDRFLSTQIETSFEYLQSPSLW